MPISVLQKAHISHKWGTAPSEPIQTNFGSLSHLMDIINFAKFHIDQSKGFDFGDIRKTQCFLESDVVLNTV